MKRILLLSSLLLLSAQSMADTNVTHRTTQVDNKKVKVWETVIYPKKEQQIQMHRHDHDRVIVAKTDGVLKVTNNKGKSHELKLEKGRIYFLSKDTLNETHTDENISGKPIKVVVVEMKD